MFEKFVPSMCQGEAATHKGTVSLKVMTYADKLDMQESFINMLPEELTSDSKKATLLSGIQILKGVAKKLPELIAEVDIEGPDGKMSTYADLEASRLGHKILQEIAQKITQDDLALGKL